MLQTVLVTLLVVGSAAYAAWTLLPATARRALATRLVALPLRWPAPLDARLRRAATAPSGCGCDGCDRAAPKAKVPATPQVVNFHPRRPR